MRLVIDTNVFISAVLKQVSAPADTLRWVDRHGGLLKSEATEQELLEVLQRPRIAARIAPVFVANVRRLLSAAEHVTISERLPVCRDPKAACFSNWQSMAGLMLLSLAIPICWPATAFVASQSSRPRRSLMSTFPDEPRSRVRDARACRISGATRP